MKKIYNLIWQDEIIDTFDSFEEAMNMLQEYQIAYHDPNITIEEDYQED